MFSSRFTPRFLPHLPFSSSKRPFSSLTTSLARPSSSSFRVRPLPSCFSFAFSHASPPSRSSSTSSSSSSSSPPVSSGTNVGSSYKPTEIPLSTTSNPEPNPGPHSSSSWSPSSSSSPSNIHSSTIKVSDTLKDAYSGLKERVVHAKDDVIHKNQQMKDRVEQGAQHLKDEVLHTAQSIKDESQKVVEKGKEKMMKMRDAAAHRVEEMERRIEEKEWGPVSGVDSSVEGTGAPSGTTKDSHPESSIARREDDAIVSVPLNAVDSFSSPSSSIEVEVPAAEHAAEVQRSGGMPSSELLGTEAVQNETGSQSIEEKARPPSPTETGKGQQGSRSHQ